MVLGRVHNEKWFTKISSCSARQRYAWTLNIGRAECLTTRIVSSHHLNQYKPIDKQMYRKILYNSNQWQRWVLWLLMAWCMRTRPSGATTHIDLFQDSVLHKFEQKGWCECDNDFKSILHVYSNQRHMPCYYLVNQIVCWVPFFYFTVHVLQYNNGITHTLEEKSLNDAQYSVGSLILNKWSNPRTLWIMLVSVSSGRLGDCPSIFNSIKGHFGRYRTRDLALGDNLLRVSIKLSFRGRSILRDWYLPCIAFQMFGAWEPPVPLREIEESTDDACILFPTQSVTGSQMPSIGILDLEHLPCEGDAFIAGCSLLLPCWALNAVDYNVPFTSMDVDL